MLAVVKRSGVTEPFSRAKVIVGVRRACQGRPVDEDALALLSQQVEEAIRATGCAEISSHEVGLEILGPLRNLDEVAYLRFASVYRSFDSVDDFENEIDRLRQEREQREQFAESATTNSESGSDLDSVSASSSERDSDSVSEADKSPAEPLASAADAPDPGSESLSAQMGESPQSASNLATVSAVGSSRRS